VTHTHTHFATHTEFGFGPFSSAAFSAVQQ